MSDFIVKDGGEYFNKGHRCLWVKLHDDTIHKLIVAEPDDGELLVLVDQGLGDE